MKSSCITTLTTSYIISYIILLKDATVIKEWAGLRPGRPQVRLERDHVRDKYGNTLEVCVTLVRHKFMLCSNLFNFLLAVPHTMGNLKGDKYYNFLP
jgi:hypothetical protein